ncbi:RagB/SusD family nutrient uptake outer membrane protein [Sphingobacterium sp.]|uniref:RagB/SusD family nutrient uptake outer membrane protein n=1 Tax=Sphingobacterium sp. TaxID=341027 RepID=UPI003FA6F748
MSISFTRAQHKPFSIRGTKCYCVGLDQKQDYLLPIPTNRLTLNPKLKQNPGL